MLRKLLGAALVLITLDGFAYPTQVELRRASPLVTDLMARDVADFKAEKKTAEEVGDAAAGYVRKATGEAAKLLLLQGAFHYYVRAKSDEKALQVVKRMQTEIVKTDSGKIVDLIERVATNLKSSDAPRLFAYYRLLRVQMAAAEELPKIRLALRSAPKDRRLVRKLGEAQAITGDWTGALETFAKLKTGVGPYARAERAGNRLDAADFWWTYESYAGQDAALIFRQHAADLYRQILKNGEVEGLRRDVVQARLEQVDRVEMPADTHAATGKTSAQGPAGESAKPNSSALYLVIDLSSGPQSEKYPVSTLTKMPAGGWTDEYKTEKLVLRRIEPGSYIMGDDQKDESHRVTITKPFYIGVFEVTQRQWKSVMGEDPSQFKGDDRPVERVSWYDCQNFVKKCQVAGVKVRLPTECEWEYACRAGGTGNWGRRANGEDGPHGTMGWYKDNSGNKTHPVAQKESNAWGLYDMHGNVWEWCKDVVGVHRVNRGGSCRVSSWNGTAGDRNFALPVRRFDHFGFRLACSQD